MDEMQPGRHPAGVICQALCYNCATRPLDWTHEGIIMPDIKTPSVPAVERALSIMELLAFVRHGLTLPELSRRLELPKSSAHCLLVTLERRPVRPQAVRTRQHGADRAQAPGASRSAAPIAYA
jgi:hypothetical protein